MRRCLVSILVLVLAGCGTSSSSGPAATASPTSSGASQPATAKPTRPTAAPAPPTPAPVHVDGSFAAFVRTICGAFARRDAATITGLLPYYQYNSGLRYGMLGDGEGQTGDPSLMRTWLANGNVRCRYMSAGSHGHGTVLATGWPLRGGSALIDLDTFSGRWKINDFTFGDHRALFQALQTARPVLPFRG